MKILSLVLALMLLLVPMVSSQNITDVVINPGTTTEQDITTLDESVSEELGGLVLQITNQFRRWIMFGESVLWERENITNEEIFDLIILPVGLEDFSDVVIGELFESSENVSVNGASPNVYSTYNATALVDGDDAQPNAYIGDVMTLLNGDTVRIPLLWDGSGEFEYEYVLNGTPGIGNSVWDIEGTAEIVELGTILYVFNDGEVYTMADLDLNGVLELDYNVSGFMTSSHEGQSVSIIPAGVYDCYKLV